MGAILLGVSLVLHMSNAAAATLHALIEREWQYQLEHSPTYASVLGDRRWNDRWDDLGLSAIEADHQHNLQVLAELQALDRGQLPDEDQLHYDLFRRDYETWIEEYRFKWYLLPVNQVGSIPEGIKQPPGIQTAYQLADTLRFATVTDYEEWITRLGGFGTYVEQILALMREGMRERLMHPQVILRRIPPQIERQLVGDPTTSGFYSPFTRFPSSISPAEQQRLSAAGRAAIERGVLPALTRFLQFLTGEYLPAAPEQVGIWQLPEGRELYGFLTRRFTTTDLGPEQIHELRLSEVQRLRDVVNEIDRYISWPGQALAYKVGQLKIRELRTRAERELGPRFNVREFHDVVLLDGSLPLDILERRIDAWVARTRAGATCASLRWGGQKSAQLAEGSFR